MSRVKLVIIYLIYRELKGGLAIIMLYVKPVSRNDKYRRRYLDHMSVLR